MTAWLQFWEFLAMIIAQLLHEQPWQAQVKHLGSELHLCELTL